MKPKSIWRDWLAVRLYAVTDALCKRIAPYQASRQECLEELFACGIISDDIAAQDGEDGE